ncbi:molybdate ABC transporter substrate-binding protein [Pseudorhodoplanes sp.]|uniref:molybdate ABC transporter substrate-binding protein n=1 Tax=Pseudorhodoplanes sp. TaxID=1934341 RepID=UPI00391DBABB
MVLAGAAFAADVTVLCTQALRTSLLELAPRFEAATGHRVNLVVAPSGQLVKKVQAGETADLLIANAENIDALIAAGKVTGPRSQIARAQVGLSIKAGQKRPDISTPDGVRRALLDARAVAYSAGGLSGNAFENVLTKLGIAEEVKAKAKNASPAARLVVSGEADLAVQQISELIAVEGAELLGPLPGELDQVTQFSMGVLSDGKQKEVARAMLDYLRTPDAQAVIKAKGLTPG